MTSPVDIRPDHLEIAQDILREHLPGDVKVWVFGSRANWTTKDSSDLDLALEGESKLSHRVLGALKDAFEDSALPYTVDVVDLNRVGDSFRQIVKSQRTPLPLDRVVTYGAPLTAASDEWCEVLLGDLIEIRHGFAFKGKFIHDGPQGDLLLTPGNFAIGGGFKRDKFKYYDGPVEEEYVLQEGDLLVTMTDLSKQSDTLGYPALVPACTDGRRYLHNQRLGKIVPKETGELHTGFLYYLMCSGKYRHEVLASATGTTVKHTSPDRIRQFKFSLPPLPEQRAIAHILGTLDNKIELNHRMNETLEAMARALFKSWFVDFEPVRAKMEGRWRPGESLPGLPADLYDLFPDRLVDSELGEIPEGWEVKALGEVVQLNPREPMKRGTLAPYLDMAALPTSGSSPDSPVLREYKSGTRFRNGDTLLARITPCLENGKTAFVQSLATGTVGWGSTEFIVLRADPPVPPQCIYLLARDDGFREHAIQSMTGTSGRQRVQVDALVPYSLPNPPAEVWTEFSALISPIFAQTEFNCQESLALAAQRDALLPRLVSGEVQVGEVSGLVG